MAEQASAEVFGAIVLAAGASTRLGQPKQLLLYRGEPLLRRAVRLALESGAEPVVAVVGSHARECGESVKGLPVHIALNPEHASGMGSSLRTGMAALLALSPEIRRALLLVADQPLLRPAHIAALLRAPAPAGIAAAAYDGRLGVPAVFGRQHYSALSAATGDHGARSLLRTLAATPVPIPEAALDIDTPEDAQDLREREAARAGE